MWLNKTLNALKTSAQYITHDDMTVVLTIKRLCNRRMSNVHDGSLGHQTLMFSSHSAWNSTPDFIVQSLHVNPQTSESTIKPRITSRHRNSIRVQGWQSQALHATKNRSHEFCRQTYNNNNNTVISIALFTDRPGALTTSDVCSTK